MAQAVNWNRWLWLTLFVAFGLRLVLAVGVQYQVGKTPGRLCLIPGDAEGYWELAGRIASGEPYSIFDPPRRLLRMPGFPALLAMPRFLFGDNPFMARLHLVLVGTIACLLTYWLGCELADKTAGILAAAYTALSPTMALFSVLFLSETGFAAAMLASLIAAARLLRMDFSNWPLNRNHVLWLAFAAGALIGLATYMRPTWLLVAPGLAFLVVLLGLQFRGEGEKTKPEAEPEKYADTNNLKQSTSIIHVPAMRARLAAALMICIGTALTLAPWTIRNAVITGHFIPTTLWVGPSLYDGLNPEFNGDSNMTFFEQDRLMASMSEYEMDREYRRRAWKFAAEHPDQALKMAFIKQSRFWSPAPNSPQFNKTWIRGLGWIAFLPLFVLATAGAWILRRDRTLLMLTVGPLLYFAALHLLFVGSLRYRLPAEYPLAVLAAAGLCKLTGRPLHPGHSIKSP
jgi:4-amino-4-deoxy-L-arabinose transferase-like glycosyltransferase